jgi:hypothetical protein
VMFTEHFGVGFGITGQGHVKPAAVRLSVPDFFDFDNPSTDETESDDLTRSEGALHISGIYAVHPSPRFTIRTFGGPTYFRATQELVEDVRYTEVISINNPSVTITGLDVLEFEGTGWGFHAGADFAGFFTRVFGLGGVVRYTKGSVTMPIALSIDTPVESDFDYPVGGFQVAGGIRLRF